MSEQAAETNAVTQDWVFSRCHLPKAAFSGQRRFLDKLRGPKARQVLAGLWSLAGKEAHDATPGTPPELAVVFDERIGHLDVVVVSLPPPDEPGAHFVALVFSEFEGETPEEVDEGMEVLIWASDGRGALMRFVGARGFVDSTTNVPLSGGNLGFFGEDLSLDAFVAQLRRRLGKPTLLERLRGLFRRGG